jgi:alpha-glucosidase/alpha-D-xyloside xylohydrolase
MGDFDRRTFLEGLGAGTGVLLLDTRLSCAATSAAGRINLSLVALTSGLLQISISPVANAIKPDELGVAVNPAAVALAPSGPAQALTRSWAKYRLEVLENPLRVRVSQNGVLRQEIRFDLDSTNVHFQLGGAPIYGLGEGTHAYDLTGTADEMSNGQHPDTVLYGARVPIPWVISPLGWGVFVGQPSGDFVFSKTEGMFRAVEATSTRNVFLALGDTPADVLREYAALTGMPHMPPLWSLGYLQSHRTLANEAEILAEAKTFRQKKLPCDGMIYLGTGFCPSGWNTGHGSFTFNDKVFPDPAVTINKFHDDDFKIVVHIVPPGDFHGAVTDGGAAAEAPGDAAGYWQKHLPLAEAGVDGWWPDEGDRLSTYARLDRNRMYWEGSRASYPGKRPFALHRNGYAGLQRYGWLWSGDVNSDWKTLKMQVMIGIAVGLSGVPYWGTDTGGFVATPELTPELYVRWFQFSAFCPSFRSHGRAWKLHLPWGWNLGTAEPKEQAGDWVANWPPDADLHRADVEEICRTYLNLRYQLLPYIYSHIAEAHRSGMPLIRALWLSYPDDAKARLAEDCYLWGDAFLVAPVLDKNARQRTHYLPAGLWWDYWSGARITGGRDVARDVDLGTMPLYVKAGAIIPMGEVKQHTGAIAGQPVTFTVYPGADGRFTWYEDDGVSFEYESGAYFRADCAWNDAARTLTVTRDARGRLGGNRMFEVRIKGGPARRVVLKDEVVIVRL